MTLAALVVLLAIPRTTICFACSSSVTGVSTSLRQQATARDDVLDSAPTTDLRQEMPRPSLLQRLTFSWVDKLLRRGNQQEIGVADLWLLPENRRTATTSRVYEDLFREEDRRLNRSEVAPSSGSILRSFWASPVTRVLLRMYRREFLVSGLLKLINTSVQFVPSLLIARLLRHVDSSGQVARPFSKQFLSNRGFVLACLLLLTLTTKTCVENQYFDLATTMGASIRGTLSSAVFRKSLRLSPSGRQNNTIGEIVNFSQLDTSRMEGVASSIHILWDSSLQVIGYTLLLLHFLGPAVFAGILAMVGTIPLNTFFLTRYPSHI